MNVEVMLEGQEPVFAIDAASSTVYQFSICWATLSRIVELKSKIEAGSTQKIFEEMKKSK